MPLELPADEIHIWTCYPDRISDSLLLNHYRQLLTEEEIQRVARYRFEHLRHDALITRALVRTVLSRYAKVDSRLWRFEKGERDKPEIIDPPLPLRFNISHTKSVIVCAVALEYDLGIDVEHVYRDSDVLGITDRFFSQQEISELFSLSTEAQQRSRFFDYWTLKESYIKALGGGLSIPLDEFSFHIGIAEEDEAGQCQNSQIHLSFAPQRRDQPEDWQSWLFYPNDSHRMGLSIRAGQQTHYRLRWFNTTPLVGHSPIELPFGALTKA